MLPNGKIETPRRIWITVSSFCDIENVTVPYHVKKSSARANNRPVHLYDYFLPVN